MQPVGYKDINVYKYVIMTNGTILEKDASIVVNSFYYSTNGNVYILLESFSGKPKLYLLDNVIYNSFYPNTQILYPNFIVRHKDQNKCNYNIDNLEMIIDEEMWVDITLPSIAKRGMYQVSSYGNVRNKYTGNLIHPIFDKDGYLKLKLMSDLHGKNCYTRINRLVALNLIPNPKPIEYNVVNHIDGDKTNNHTSNLEWSDIYLNNLHAKLTKLNYTPESHTLKSSVTDDEVDMIIEKLLDPKYYGSPMKIYKDLNHDKYPHINHKTIQAIKYKYPAFIRPTTKYRLNDLTFERSNVSKVSTSDIDMVVEKLMDPKYNHSPLTVYKSLDHNKYKFVTRSVVCHIKNRKDTYVRPDAKYNLKTVDFKVLD